MKNFFKPEDFRSGHPDKPESYVDAHKAAKIANEKLNKLIESWSVVYGKNNQWDITDGRPDSYLGCTHKARLAFIEEIPKEQCKHEPISLLGKGYSQEISYRGDISEFLFSSKCKHCGVELVAEWKEKK